MPILHAVILGFVQGIAEFLPISSSGFLILTPHVFGWEEQSLAFDTTLHLATLAAVIVALWPEVKKWRSYASWIVLATIPALVVGFLIEKVWQLDLRSVNVVGWSFIIWGVVLFVADQYAKSIPADVTKVGLKRAMWIGLAQAVALIPGTSRSGITITAGLFSGLSRRTAATFSFLLGIPTIAAAGTLNLIDMVKHPDTVDLAPLIVGFLVAFLTGLFTIKFFLRFLEKNSFREIAVLRVMLGILILVTMS